MTVKKLCNKCFLSNKPNYCLDISRTQELTFYRITSERFFGGPYTQIRLPYHTVGKWSYFTLGWLTLQITHDVYDQWSIWWPLFFFLFQLGMRKSLLYVVNGILLATMFLFCRILIYPYMYWCYSKYANISLLETPFKVPLFCNTFCFFLLSVQVYWFLIIMRGVLRFLQRPTDMPQAPISKVNGENGFLHKNHSTAAGYNANEKIK